MKTTLDLPRLARTGSLGPLSEAIIPTVPGTCYVYQSTFTDDKPLFALLDCKANKNRKLAHAGELGHEVHLCFGFDATNRARVSSIKTAQAAGLLGHVNAEFNDVQIAPADVAIEDFYILCAQRDSAKLMNVCKTACRKRELSIGVTPGMIVAVMTNAGKYGLFLVKDITPRSISVDACHILLT